MSVASCSSCQSRFQIDPKSVRALVCPRCKAPLTVEAEKEKPAAKPVVEEPLSLDDATPFDDAPSPMDFGRTESEQPAAPKARGFRVKLIAGLALGLMLHATAVAVWFFLPSTEPEQKTAEAAPAEQTPPKPKEKDSAKKADQTAKSDDIPNPGSKPELSPIVLLARAKSGAALQRVEAIDKLAGLGDQARFAVPDLIPMLDDADEGVRRVAAVALERIGSPTSADAACIPRALSGMGRQGRLFALKHYSRNEAASAEQLPLIAAALADTDLATRDQALSALERFGPKCKSVAFPALLGHMLDTDAALAARVAKVLVAFAPYDGTERKLLVERLSNQSWQLRRTAVVLLAASAPDESLAAVWFEPRLKDDSAEVRAVALPALAKWPNVMKRLQPALLGLIRDDHAGVRTAAIRALGEFGAGAEAKTALLGLAGPGSAADTRDLALKSLLAMNYSDAKTDLPILVGLLKLDDAKVKAAAFDKATALKADAKEFLPQVEAGLKHSDAAVQSAALRLAAVIGPDAASLVPRISALLLDKKANSAESVQVQAAAALVQLGPTAKASLLAALAAPLPAAVLKSVCDSLGGKGAEVPAKSIPQLFALAERTEDLRPALGDLLARIGGDDIVNLCAERTTWSWKAFSNKTIKECKYELAVQVWAIETMGKLDPKAMTVKGRGVLIERMKSLAKTNPDVECKRAAEASGLKLAAAGLGDKP